MNAFEKVYEVVSHIPKGKVMTYKSVSEISGVGDPRVVGFALHVNKDIVKIPCHRVVKSSGELATGYARGGKSAQIAILESEGVAITKERIDLDKFQFLPQ